MHFRERPNPTSNTLFWRAADDAEGDEDDLNDEDAVDDDDFVDDSCQPDFPRAINQSAF